MNEDTIRKDFWKVIFDLLKVGVTTVSNRVYANYPVTSITLPLLIVGNPSIRRMPFLSSGGYEVTFVVEICSKTSADVDTISDLVAKTINGANATLWSNSMYLLEEYDGMSPATYEDVNGNLSHHKIMSFKFRAIR